MKTYKLLIGLIIIPFFSIGCNSAWLQVIADLSEAYEYEVHEEYDYYEYGEADIYEVKHNLKIDIGIWIGTTIIIGDTHCHWCDYCHIWHPRCSGTYCHCASSVRRSYSYYSYGVYVNHCYRWTYRPHYSPVISTYRFKNKAGVYHTYNIAEQKRKFTKPGFKPVSSSRIGYRGAEKITYKKESLNRVRSTRDKDIGNTPRSAEVTKSEKASSSSSRHTKIQRNGNKKSSDDKTRVSSRSAKKETEVKKSNTKRGNKQRSNGNRSLQKSRSSDKKSNSSRTRISSRTSKKETAIRKSSVKRSSKQKSINKKSASKKNDKVSKKSSKKSRSGGKKKVVKKN